MTFKTIAIATAISAPFSLAQPATAETTPTFGGPVAVGDGIVIDPILDGRLRWEDVSQPTKDLSADAVTMRLRAGVAVRDAPAHLALLAEMQGNLALDTAYNAFPYALPASSQYRPARAVIADPQSVDLNRLQLQYRDKILAVTLGRQLINLDDQRWVGASAWRQNEQTFDAVRGELTLGPVGIDATYADSQRSVYGSDGGPRVDYDGHFGFLGASVKAKYLTVKGFAYLLDYDPTAFINQPAARSQLDSSRTYGFRAKSWLPLSEKVRLDLAGSYARQSSYANNPRHYAADYVAAEGDLSAYGFTATAGYEKLGSDADAVGGAWSVQTPMATIHSFDGFADVFLTTPARGLQDSYGGLGYVFPRAVGVPGLNAKLVYRRFNSDLGNLDYGHEWDASLGFKTGCLKWLVQYADYTAVGAANIGAGATTKKFWLQTEVAF